MPNKLQTAESVPASDLEDSIAATLLSGSEKDNSLSAYILTTLPSKGTLYLDAEHTTLARVDTVYTSKTFYFLPYADFDGTASFQYKVRDNQGGISANQAEAKINVSAVNDALVLDLIESARGISLTLDAYSPGGAAARIAPSATVVDIDPSNCGGTLCVSITDKTNADQLTITTDATVMVNNKGAVFVAGTKVGDLVSDGKNGSDLVIKLANGAKPDSVAVLLEHVSYSNSLAYPPASMSFGLAFLSKRAMFSATVPSNKSMS